MITNLWIKVKVVWYGAGVDSNISLRGKNEFDYIIFKLPKNPIDKGRKYITAHVL